ncbi:hypothetical protein OF83DRAFT_1178780 [Amylostereum chailletii]|nr:hypothetical protein OF83DRAFT_1178780 [Amylostereum chailletii]
MGDTIITLYDIPGTTPTNAWSPNVWIARFALAMKGLVFKTVWIEYPDIAPELQKLGIGPTTSGDGSTQYTLPALHDPRTGTLIADSLAIVEYLDETYPSAGGVTFFPAGTRALQRAWRAAFNARLLAADLSRLMVHITLKQLNPSSVEYFQRTRQISYEKPLEELAPAGSDERAVIIKTFVKGLSELAKWLDEANGEGSVFVMGDKGPTYADVLMAGWLIFVRVCAGEESDVWQAVIASSGGRWERYMAEFKKWEIVV